MKPTEFEKRMRVGEYFHELRLPPETWTVIRVDGRSFTRFTASRFEKPYDERFRDLMIQVCEALMKEMNGIYAFTESDEASILFPPAYDMFDREVEKLVSVSAGIASAAFTKGCGEAAHFDSRIWVGATTESVVDYFMWRHSDAARCCLNAWAYWTLRDSGKTYSEVTSDLERQSVGAKNELLFQHGINFNDIPEWQKRGVGVTWQSYETEGLNPVTNSMELAVRRKLVPNLNLPMKDQYSEFMRAILAAPASS